MLSAINLTNEPDTPIHPQVKEEVKRAKTLKCGLGFRKSGKVKSGCGLGGATIGCSVPSCGMTYHYPCTLLTGWKWKNSRRFLCPKHRGEENFDSEINCVCQQIGPLDAGVKCVAANHSICGPQQNEATSLPNEILLANYRLVFFI